MFFARRRNRENIVATFTPHSASPSSLDAIVKLNVATKVATESNRVSDISSIGLHRVLDGQLKRTSGIERGIMDSETDASKTGPRIRTFLFRGFFMKTPSVNGALIAALQASRTDSQTLYNYRRGLRRGRPRVQDSVGVSVSLVPPFEHPRHVRVTRNAWLVVNVPLDQNARLWCQYRFTWQLVMPRRREHFRCGGPAGGSDDLEARVDRM